MTTFVIRRFFTSILALIGATIVIFGASRILGDPTVLFLPEEGYGLDAAELEKARQKLHLDKPVPLQYAFWVADILRGDLGQDLSDRHPISTKLRDKLPPTLRLAVAAYIISTLIGIPLGVLSAVKRGSVWDFAGRTFALLGQALPIFWVAYPRHPHIHRLASDTARRNRGRRLLDQALCTAYSDPSLVPCGGIPASHALGDARRSGLRIR